MNLGELRLKALQSLKRPYTSTIPTEPDTSINETNRISSEQFDTINTADVPVVVGGKEEGEITDDEVPSQEEEQEVSSEENFYRSNTNSSIQKNNTKYPEINRKPLHAKYNTNKRNTKWTRQTDYRDLQEEDQEYDSADDSTIEEEEASFGLSHLINEKARVLELLDENQSLFAASEDKEHDLLELLKECCATKRDCQRERSKLDRKLERLSKRITTREFIEGEASKKVSSTNFKKQFVGELLKGSYCRSLRDFASSDLCKLYCDTLSIDAVDMAQIEDVNQPICPTELQKGRCKYKDRGTCSMQHLKM